LALLLAPKPSVRVIALPVAALLMASTVVQLTRARWIGLIAGLLAIGLWLAVQGDRRVTATARRRALLTVGLLGTAVILAILLVPGLLSGGTVGDRFISAFTDLQKGGGTVAVRESASHALNGYVGEDWSVGLGFVSPSSHWYFGMPEGSIRDTDL